MPILSDSPSQPTLHRAAKYTTHTRSNRGHQAPVVSMNTAIDNKTQADVVQSPRHTEKVTAHMFGSRSFEWRMKNVFYC